MYEVHVIEDKKSTYNAADFDLAPSWQGGDTNRLQIRVHRATIRDEAVFRHLAAAFFAVTHNITDEALHDAFPGGQQSARQKIKKVLAAIATGVMEDVHVDASTTRRRVDMYVVYSQLEALRDALAASIGGQDVDTCGKYVGDFFMRESQRSAHVDAKQINALRHWAHAYVSLILEAKEEILRNMSARVLIYRGVTTTFTYSNV